MIDLERPREVGSLLHATFEVFGQNWKVFLTLTFTVVAPVVVLVDGVWGHQLRDGLHAHASPLHWVVSAVATWVVVPATVTGMHCVVVRELGRGRRLSVGGAFGGLWPRLWEAIGAVALYTVAIAIGYVLLVVPGIWLSVRLYFAAQAAVLEELEPVPALRRSADLVAGQWWRVFGLLLVSGLVVGALMAPLTALSILRDHGWFVILGQVIARTLGLSLSAIFATLLFFDLRARAAAPAPALR